MSIQRHKELLPGLGPDATMLVVKKSKKSHAILMCAFHPIALREGHQRRIGCFRGAATSQLHDDSEGPAGYANKFSATGPKAGQDQTGHP